MDLLEIIILGSIIYLFHKGFLKTACLCSCLVILWIGITIWQIQKNTPSKEEKACKLLMFVIKDEHHIFNQYDELKRELILSQLKEIKQNKYDCSKYQ